MSARTTTRRLLPRLRDLKDRKLYAFRGQTVPDLLTGLTGGTVDSDHVPAHWEQQRLERGHLRRRQIAGQLGSQLGTRQGGGRADIQKHLGDDPFASLRAIARSIAENLGLATDEEQARAMLLVRAMIAAAKADGEVDPDERARIVARLKTVGAEDNALRFVEEELAKPVDLYSITAEVRDAATAAEVYAASLAAIQLDTEAERTYLDNLALCLGLDRDAVDGLHSRLGSDAARPN